MEKTNSIKIRATYVIRLTDGFQYNDFKHSVAKFVRENHVQTDKHWMTKQIKANRLKLE